MVFVGLVMWCPIVLGPVLQSTGSVLRDSTASAELFSQQGCNKSGLIWSVEAASWPSDVSLPGKD